MYTQDVVYFLLFHTDSKSKQRDNTENGTALWTIKPLQNNSMKSNIKKLFRPRGSSRCDISSSGDSGCIPLSAGGRISSSHARHRVARYNGGLPCCSYNDKAGLK